MADPHADQRLAAILAADVAGYSRLMEADERATVATLDAYRAVFQERVAGHGGRIVDTAGDSVLAIFPSAIGAVEAAIEIQDELGRRNEKLPEHQCMHFRLGVNLGDVIEKDDGSIYGSGVNVAARLEGLAEPGGICVSGKVIEEVEGKTDCGFEDIGDHEVKNIAKPLRVYRVRAESESVEETETPRRRRKMGVGVIVVAALVLIGAGWGLLTILGADRDVEIAAQDQHVLAPAAVERMAYPLPDEPSIAVLPFDNLSEDASQDYFVDGLTEEIIATLARFPDLAVIARNSTFRYKGQAVDVRAVGEELGARYIVEGSVRRGGETLRVTAQLIEAETGWHLWSETYDRALTAENVFAIQDDIAATVANTLAGRFGVLSQERLAAVRRKPPSQLSSYDCVLLAMEFARTLSLEHYRTPRDCLEGAVENDPDYAAAWSNLAVIYVDGHTMGYDPRPGLLDRALEAAQRAVALAPGDSFAHWSLAWAHFFRGELDAFRAAVERAVEGASKGASFLGNAGLFLAYAGEWDRGLALIEETKAFDPYYPGGYHFGAFFDHYRKGEYEAALAAAHMTNLPDYVWAQAILAAAYGQLDRADEAQPHVNRILELNPDFEATARANRWKWFRYQEDLLDHFMDGLRKAGLDLPDEPSAAD